MNVINSVESLPKILVISCGGTIAMTTKLMWLLDKKIPYRDFKRRMQENIAGEIVIDGGDLIERL